MLNDQNGLKLRKKKENSKFGKTCQSKDGCQLCNKFCEQPNCSKIKFRKIRKVWRLLIQYLYTGKVSAGILRFPRTD